MFFFLRNQNLCLLFVNNLLYVIRPFLWIFALMEIRSIVVRPSKIRSFVRHPHFETFDLETFDLEIFTFWGFRPFDTFNLLIYSAFWDICALETFGFMRHSAFWDIRPFEMFDLLGHSALWDVLPYVNSVRMYFFL